MKKSLKVIASAAVAFSMFASVAMADTTATTTTSTTATTTTAAKTSKDFKDLAGLDATLVAKIDALLSKNVFEGVSADSFGITQNMTRAQFAKVLVLVYGVKVDDTVKTSSFADVKADDTANGWAIPYIEAAKKAGLIDGISDTTFAPGDNVTLGQFATALVKGLGKKVDFTGTPWYKDAIAQAVTLKVLPEGTDGSKAATRGDLVVGAFGGYNAYLEMNKPAKASVTEAKATGVQTVSVTLNRDVDATKATLELKKGNVSIQKYDSASTAIKWSDDKKTATLTLSSAKISAGEYSVTLAGLDATAIDTATAKFTGQDEVISKIDFVNAGDTLAYSANARVKLKATNQYGEVASQGQAAFSAFVNGAAATLKGSTGDLTIETATNGAGYVQGQSIIPVTVYYNDTRVTVTKNFKLGTAPFLTKVELGTVVYSNNGTSLSASGDYATIPLKLYDQYGNPVIQAQFQGGTPEIQASTINAIVAPYSANVTYDSTKKFDNDGNPQAIINLTNKEDKAADYSVNVYAGSSSATATVKVGASNLPTKVEFGTFTDTIAAGDTTAYVPVIATDANGKQLSAQDIVDNASRFTFSATNQATGTTPSIVAYGKNKGKLQLNLDPATKAKSSVYVTGLIATANANSYAQTTISVQETRVPDHFAIDTEPAAKAILGASSDVIWKLKDQYNSDISTIGTDIAGSNGQVSNYKVVVTISGDTSTSGISLVEKATTPVTLDNSKLTQEYTGANLARFNSGFTFNTNSALTGKVTVKAVVQRSLNGAAGTYSDYSTPVSRTLEAVKNDTSLTYSLNTIADLFTTADTKNSPVAADYDLTAITSSFFAKKPAVTAKDSSGATVKLPNNFVRGISSSNTSVVATTYNPSVSTSDGYILGVKAGTATVTAVVYTNKGATLLLTQDVNVKADAITVASIAADNSNVALGSNTTVFGLFGNLTVKDQYGTEYKNGAIVTYDKLLGIRYTVSGVKGGGTVTLDAAAGTFTKAGTVNEFLVTATSPNGKSVQVLVTN